MSMDDFELEEYGGNTVDDMMVDYNYHIINGDLPNYSMIHRLTTSSLTLTTGIDI